jgi:glycosyltransferase involved in cell wall biosynthesis
VRLAIVTHNVVKGDGQGRVNLELAHHLLAQGVEVTLLADTVDDKLIGAEFIPLHPKPFADAVDLIKVWRFRQMANGVLDDMGDRFDAVLACGVTLNRPHTINAVHFVHGSWLNSPFHASKVQSGPRAWYQYAFSALNARWERQTFSKATTIVAVSGMVRDELTQIGVPSDKIEVIVNGVDIDEFQPGPADRSKLGLPANVPLGLFVGDIQSPIKNLDGVLRGLADVTDIHLAVAGALPRSPYPALAESLGIADRIHFLGFRRDIADLMRTADFFTLPSRRDSCPLVLLEAMASGLPIIVSRQVGTADLVEEGECGFVLRTPDDYDTLRRGLTAFRDDYSLRAEMGRAARTIAERHSWKQMSQQYLDLLREQVQSAPHTSISAHQPPPS